MKKVWAMVALGAGLVSMGAAAEWTPGFWQHHIKTEISIPASTERVWALLMDFEGHPRWNPFIRQIQGASVVGQKLQVRVQPVGGREMEFEPEVLVVQPQQVFRWKGQWLMPGLFDGEHYFELRSDAGGTTVLVHGERFSGLLVPVLRGQLNSGTRPGFEAMNKALKEEVQRIKSGH